MGIFHQACPEPHDRDDEINDIEINEQDDDLQGEGDYRAARKFQWEEREFVMDEEQVRRAAREAADALDGPEGDELERARAAAAKGKIN